MPAPSGFRSWGMSKTSKVQTIVMDATYRLVGHEFA